MKSQWLTFRDLLEKYGDENASEILNTIERLADMPIDAAITNREARLQLALDALNDNVYATKH